jgi:hypothetical protein
MKTYEVELKRVTYVTVTIDAENPEKAEELAWAQVESGAIVDDYGNWKIENIEELT